MFAINTPNETNQAQDQLDEECLRWNTIIIKIWAGFPRGDGWLTLSCRKAAVSQMQNNFRLGLNCVFVQLVPINN